MKSNSIKFSKSIIVSILFILFGLLSVACNGNDEVVANETLSAASQITLTVSGSGSTMSVLEGLKDEFEAAMPNYQLELLQGTGSGGGVKGVVDGVLDVAALSRTLNEEEAEQGLEFIGFGKAATAVFTHPDVTVSDLSSEQMAAIFTGDITNWSAVGGPDETIILFVRDENDSSTSALREEVFGNTTFAESAQVITSATDMLNIVAGTEHSVGFGTWPAARATDIDVTAVALDGLTPADASYPITNEMGLAFFPDRKTDVQPFIDWLLAEEGQVVLTSFDMILAP
ncbi:MAG: substrate-binding domain-containing protein [Anaerolineae bacterium]|nr:substrate-binding domain-containing protein [Anaerolineae bacterium]